LPVTLAIIRYFNDVGIAREGPLVLRIAAKQPAAVEITGELSVNFSRYLCLSWQALALAEIVRNSDLPKVDFFY